MVFFFFFSFFLPFLVTLSLGVVILQSNPPSLARVLPSYICQCLTSALLADEEFYKSPVSQECLQGLPCFIPPTPSKAATAHCGGAADAAWQENSLGKSSHLSRRNRGAGAGGDSPISECRAYQPRQKQPSGALGASALHSPCGVVHCFISLGRSL